MIDIEQLKVFLVAAETLNFSETARRLMFSQPTVSKRIQDLERALKNPLFDRSSAQLKLTDAGKTLLPLARKMVHQMYKIENVMDSLQVDVTGSLSIACSTTARKYILPQLAARFKPALPGHKCKDHRLHAGERGA
jgi:DNA-binding transcriptional LysR family regulator